MDRLGRNVKDYPFEIEGETNLQHSLFDYDNSKDYRIIIANKKGKILNNHERDRIYKILKIQNLKEKISLIIQRVLNIIPQNKKILIFSTYMSNLQEIWLNLITNKSLLFSNISKAKSICP